MTLQSLGDDSVHITVKESDDGTEDVIVCIEDPLGRFPEDMYGWASFSQDELRAHIRTLQTFLR